MQFYVSGRKSLLSGTAFCHTHRKQASAIDLLHCTSAMGGYSVSQGCLEAGHRHLCCGLSITDLVPAPLHDLLETAIVQPYRFYCVPF